MQARIEYLKKNLSLERQRRIFEIIEERTRQITIILEDFYQSHNASATLRTAEALGLTELHIIENQNKWNKNPEVSLGAEKWLRLIQYTNTTSNKNDPSFSEACLKNLRQQGYSIVATSLKENSLQQANLDILAGLLKKGKKLALAFGNEEHGLSQHILNSSDYYLKLPLHGFTQSYNVSVSVGMSLFYLMKVLRENSNSWKLSEKEKEELTLHFYRQSIKESKKIENRFENKI